VTSRLIVTGGEDPGEDKTQEGLDRGRGLTASACGTDSQGEQSREAGQRHLPCLLGMTVGAPGVSLF